MNRKPAIKQVAYAILSELFGLRWDGTDFLIASQYSRLILRIWLCTMLIVFPGSQRTKFEYFCESSRPGESFGISCVLRLSCVTIVTDFSPMLQVWIIYWTHSTFRGQQPHKAFITSLQPYTQQDAGRVHAIASNIRVQGDILPEPSTGEISRIKLTPTTYFAKRGKERRGGMEVFPPYWRGEQSKIIPRILLCTSGFYIVRISYQSLVVVVQTESWDKQYW